VVLHVVSPLLFFTDLTRNPYQTQITLLTLGVLLMSGLQIWGESVRPEGAPIFTRLERAFLAGLLLLGLSWALSWWRHPGFRTPIAHDGFKAWTFMAIFAFLSFRLGARFGFEPQRPSSPKPSVWPLLAFALFWGLLWVPFRSVRHAGSSLWDPYGALLWMAAIVFALRFTRGRTGADYARLMCLVSLVAGGYAVMQYFGKDIIWTGFINPYSGRPVSTFGNPNFLSSYLVLTFPVALALTLASRRGSETVGHLVLLAGIGASLLSTLTRSSWAGAPRRAATGADTQCRAGTAA
jgi:hypothetical protein